MTMVPPKYAAVRVRLTQADKDALTARAKRDDVPLSVIIRRAIRGYMSQQVRPAAPVRSSFLTSSNGESGA